MFLKRVVVGLRRRQGIIAHRVVKFGKRIKEEGRAFFVRGVSVLPFRREKRSAERRESRGFLWQDDSCVCYNYHPASKNPGRKGEGKGLLFREILRRAFLAVRRMPGQNKRPDVAENTGTGLCLPGFPTHDFSALSQPIFLRETGRKAMPRRSDFYDFSYEVFHSSPFQFRTERTAMAENHCKKCRDGISLVKRIWRGLIFTKFLDLSCCENEIKEMYTDKTVWEMMDRMSFWLFHQPLTGSALPVANIIASPVSGTHGKSMGLGKDALCI